MSNSFRSIKTLKGQKLSLEILSGKAKELANRYQLTVEKIKAEIEANKVFAAVYKQQLTELIDAQKMLQPQREQSIVHNKLLDELPILIQELEMIPGNISEMETSIASQLVSNKLELIEFYSYNHTTNANDIVTSARCPLSTSLQAIQRFGG